MDRLITNEDMRKYTLAAMLLVAIGAMGAPVDEQQARQEAETFFLQRGKVQGTRNLTATGKVSLSLVHKKGEKTIPAYYIFNREGGGYAVVSGNDRQPAILGYSDTGCIAGGDMPDAMLWWIEELAECGALSSDTSERKSGNGCWTGIRRGEEDRPAIAPMIASQWGQYAPYNEQTPVIDGQHAPTGCAATAMAQIMRYQQWPDTCSYIPATSQYDEQLSTSFDWDLMVDSYMQARPVENRAAVAKLMWYAGRAAKTTYKVDASSTNVEDIVNACQGLLRFSESIYYERSDYDSDAWEGLVYESLQNGDPVLYGGNKRTRGGHVFVCDGYEDGYYHFNWGWNGAYDGYFLLSNLNPGGNEYNYNQYIITGLHKPENPPAVDDGIDYSLHLTTVDIAFDPVESDAGCLERSSEAEAFQGIVIRDIRYLDKKRSSLLEFGLGLCDGEGNMIQMLSDSVLMINRQEYYEFTYRVSFGGGLPDGTYRLRGFSRDNKSNVWLADENSDNAYLEAIVEGNRLSLNNALFVSVDVPQLYATYLGEQKYLERESISDDFKGLHVVVEIENPNTSLHTLEYAIGLFQHDTMLDIITESAPLPIGEFEVDLDFGANLPDGDYQLKMLCREAGMNRWITSEMSKSIEVTIVGDRLLTYSDSEVQGRMEGPWSHPLGTDIQYSLHYVHNPESGAFENIPLFYKVTLDERQEKYHDHQLRLCSDDSEESISFTRYGLNFKSISLSDTITISGNLPDGRYTLKSFTRPSSRAEWTEDEMENPENLLYCVIRDDTLHLVIPEEEGMKYAVVESFDYELYDFTREKHQYNLLLNYAPEDENATNASGAIWIAYTDDENEWREIPFTLSLSNTKTSKVVMLEHPIHGDYCIYSYGREKTVLCQGSITNETPVLSMDFWIDNSFIAPNGEEYSETVVSGGLFNVSVTCSPSSKIKIRPFVRIKVPTDSVNRPLDRSMDIYVGEVPQYLQKTVLFYTNEEYYFSHIGDSCVIEYGYMYSSKANNTFDKYMTMGCSSSYMIRSSAYYYLLENGEYNYYNYVIEDTLAIPSSAVHVNLAGVNFEKIVFSPNENPNCIYVVNNYFPIPDCLNDKPLMNRNNDQMASFHLQDGYSCYSANVRPDDYSFTRTFPDGVWSTFMLPFTPDEESWKQLRRLQFKVLKLEGSSLQLVELGTDKNAIPNGKSVDYIYLVKGNGETVTFWPDKSKKDFRLSLLDQYGYNSEFGYRKTCLVAAPYENYYTLLEDGSAFVLSSGTTEPFRSYIVPYEGELPERLEVPAGSSIATAITEQAADGGKRIVSRHTIDGRCIEPDDRSYRGIVIEKYSDGTTRKTLRR